MDLSHELARYLSNTGKERLANLDPETAKEQAEFFFVTIHLLPPNQLKSMSQIELGNGDQEQKDKWLESIPKPLPNIVVQYHNALDPKSREEIALLGLERIKKTDMQTLWDSRYKHKSHTDST